MPDHICCGSSVAADLDLAVLEHLESTGAKAPSSSGFASAAAYKHYAPSLSTCEPTHIDIALAFDIPAKAIRGVVTTTFKNPRALPGISRTVLLNAVGFLDVAVKGVGVEVWTYDGERIAVTWSEVFAAGEERVVEVAYAVEKPLGGLYFEVPTADFPNRVAHAVTHNEPERARYWLPCIDYPAVRTTLSFALTHPSSTTAIANGTLISETGTTIKTTRYALDLPCPSYLICLAVGDMVFYEDEAVDGMPVRYYAPRGTAPADLKRSFGTTPAMLRWLQKKVGVKFPYPKYYQIATYLVGGAMENISLVTWVADVVSDETTALDRARSTASTNIHEMAHSYFGDLLVIRILGNLFPPTLVADPFPPSPETLWLEATATIEDAHYELLTASDGYLSEAARYTRPI
ncbi:peptidase family M1-domain-containing protein, partial [Blyttiomyces helicus]